MRRISTARGVVYLRTLADTGNATLAAKAAGVSKSWAYKRREVDPRFAGWCRQMVELAKARLPARVNRDRADGWTAAKEARFLERLAQTCSVPLAAAEVNLSAGSAYHRRKMRPAFAAAWEDAERIGWPPADQPWMESAVCFFEGREPPLGNPVRITSIGEVLDALEGKQFAPRGRGRSAAKLTSSRTGPPAP